jgi:hypothetical protein
MNYLFNKENMNDNMKIIYGKSLLLQLLPAPISFIPSLANAVRPPTYLHQPVNDHDLHPSTEL